MATDPYGLIASGLPPEIAAEAMGLRGRQAIMQALLAQSQQPLEAPEAKGRFSVPINPLQGMAKLAQAYIANRGLRDTDKAMGELGNKYQKGIANSLSGYEATKRGAPAVPFVDEQAQAMDLPQPPGLVAKEAVPGDPRKAVTDALMNPYIKNNPLIASDLKEIQETPKTRKVIDGEMEIHQERQLDGSWKEVGRGPRFAKQVAPVINNNDKRPIVVTDAAGNTKLVDLQGNIIKDLGAVGKPTATHEKTVAAQKKLKMDLDAVIPNLEAISKDGGLLDQATGSGAGALVDMAAGFFGKATPGSIAVGQLQPMVDPILKLVPRFEGPQSDKDTTSYKEAAGNLANPNVPNERKKAAARVILKIYKERQGQFTTTDFEATNPQPGPASNVRVVDW